MNCKCGGSTKDHKVQRQKKVVAEFKRCEACGRVSWIWGPRPEPGSGLVGELTEEELLKIAEGPYE